MIEIFDLLKCSGFSARKFHELGLRLGLLKRTLDAIEMDKMGDPDESLRECLSKWLDRVDNVDIKGGATIDSLSNALRAMGETAVSDKIDQKSELYTPIYLPCYQLPICKVYANSCIDFKYSVIHMPLIVPDI